MDVSAQDVLNYVVSRAVASEENPLRLGNVEFWHPVPGYGVGLCYSPSMDCWDKQAVQDDLNRITSDFWDDMMEHLSGCAAE